MAEHYDVLIVGTGPGGLAAAAAAASHGVRVGLVDAQPRAGGQVWRHDVDHGVPALARRYLQTVRVAPANLSWLAGTSVVAGDHRQLLLESERGARWVGFDRLILATGARELLLPFPGWTLPGVTGAGGLQALAKQGWPMAGKRVVLAGSGPLLLASAATLKAHGATVVCIAEQAGLADLAGFAAGLWRFPSKLAQAGTLRRSLRDVPYRRGALVTAAHGVDHVEAVTLRTQHGEERIACDLVGVGYGLVPNTRLARQIGCRVEARGRHDQVWVDERQRTSIENIFAVGEACGIGGRDCARHEGELAGHAAVEGAAIPARVAARCAHARRFRSHLGKHFRLSESIRRLARPDTIVCRCEDVPLQAVTGATSSREAKLATRCGMGPCQGRICGTALAEMGHFPIGHDRLPLFPARLETLASQQDDQADMAPVV